MTMTAKEIPYETLKAIQDRVSAEQAATNEKQTHRKTQNDRKARELRELKQEPLDRERAPRRPARGRAAAAVLGLRRAARRARHAGERAPLPLPQLRHGPREGIMTNDDRYEDCEACGERFHGADAIRDWLQETNTGWVHRGGCRGTQPKTAAVSDPHLAEPVTAAMMS